MIPARFHSASIGLILSVLLLLFAPSCLPLNTSFLLPYQPVSDPLQLSVEFNGTRAYTYLETQCGFGPRPPGSDNLTSCGDYIISVLENANWAVQTQTWTYQSTFLRNIMAGAIDVPNYVLLAHYDTRPIADMDPDPANRTQPILGANDGGSGVAALLELAAVLPPSAKDHVMLLFVDAEDSGNYNGWEWIVGSTYYVNSLTDNQKNAIHAAVLLDMVGDADLQLKREQSSTERLVDVIWGIASNLGYETMFLNEPGVSLIDDHRPFLSVGIPAIDIIDFDYPYWHTQADTLDKCSPSSLEVVGRVIEDFIQQQLILPTNFKSESLLPMIFFILLVIVMPIIVFILLILFIYQRKFQHNT